MSRIRLQQTDLHWREIDGEVIALDARGSTYVATNGSGTLLWRALAEGATLDELTDTLVRSFGIDHGRAAADVDAFVAQLSGQGLLAP